MAITWGAALYALDATLYINAGSVTYNQGDVGWCVFNVTPELEVANARLVVGVNETLVVTVVNTTDFEQTFTIDGLIEEANSILPGVAETFEFQFDQEGAYRYYSKVPMGEFAGASGMISVTDSGDDQYYWNLFDLNIDLSQAFISGAAEDYDVDYKPELFTINGRFYPSTLEDMDVMIMGMVGQTVYINIVNSGYMDHVMHFHGYHVEIVASRIQPERAGWSKDSVPVKRGDAMRLKLYFDQPGMYPVHDHNLIAVTNAGLYPGGMITHIEVMP